MAPTSACMRFALRPGSGLLARRYGGMVCATHATYARVRQTAQLSVAAAASHLTQVDHARFVADA